MSRRRDGAIVLMSGLNGLAMHVLLGCLFPCAALAHGDIDVRIAELSRRIDAEPPAAELLIKRAELNRAHGAWPQAHRDLDRAAAISPGNERLLFSRGRLWLESGRADRAVHVLDEFIVRLPRDPQARLLRARAFKALGKPANAAADLRLAIAELSSPSPELYLEHARLLAAAGDVYAGQALGVLDAAIATLGPTVTLIELAMSLESGRARFDSALQYLDRLPAKLRQRPVWLTRRAELLMLDGRQVLASTACSAARDAIERLPQSRRTVRAVLALDYRLQQVEEQLN